MNKKTIFNILSQNIDSYNAIAPIFSKSRERFWNEFYGKEKQNCYTKNGNLVSWHDGNNIFTIEKK